jgi:hypothetical protein
VSALGLAWPDCMLPGPGEPAPHHGSGGAWCIHVDAAVNMGICGPYKLGVRVVWGFGVWGLGGDAPTPRAWKPRAHWRNAQGALSSRFRARMRDVGYWPGLGRLVKVCRGAMAPEHDQAQHSTRSALSAPVNGQTTVTGLVDPRAAMS